MTDRELLELAAKAAGKAILFAPDGTVRDWTGASPAGCLWSLPVWAPLQDDGDALRLAAKLKIDLEWQATGPFPDPDVEAYRRTEDGSYFCASEHESDYRRAIVRVAAEIGKAMP